MSEEEAFEHAIEMIQTRQMGFRKAADFFSVIETKYIRLERLPISFISVVTYQKYTFSHFYIFIGGAIVARGISRKFMTSRIGIFEIKKFSV
jgi:hypothetical protein